MINKVILIGNVGGDPTIRCFDNGNSVAKFRVVTTERFKDKDGTLRELNEWHTVEAWGKPASVVDQYVRKGDRLYIEGKIHYEEYTDKNNVTRYQTIIRLSEIKLLTPRPKEENQVSKEESQAMPEPPQVPLPPLEEQSDLPF